MRNSDSFLKLAIAAILALLLAACGGGGGGGSSASSSASNASAPTQSVTNTSSSTQVLAANAVAVTVDSGVSGVPNMPFVSVTVCTPGTTQCQTINHVLVDTGSWGLRVFAAQLPVVGGAAAATGCVGQSARGMHAVLRWLYVGFGADRGRADWRRKSRLAADPGDRSGLQRGAVELQQRRCVA